MKGKNKEGKKEAKMRFKREEYAKKPVTSRQRKEGSKKDGFQSRFCDEHQRNDFGIYHAGKSGSNEKFKELRMYLRGRTKDGEFYACHFPFASRSPESYIDIKRLPASQSERQEFS